MIIMLFYKSDETCPYAVHLCESFTEEAGFLKLISDRTETHIIDYDYYHTFKAMNYEEETHLVDIMTALAKTIKDEL